MRTARLVALGLVVAALSSIGQKASAGDTPADAARREALARLDSVHFSGSFTDNPLVDVIDLIRDFSGLNFTWSKDARARLAEDPPPTVSLTVRDLPLRAALRFILDQNDLTAVLKDAVIVISTKEEIERITVTVTYDVRDLLLQLRDFPGPEIQLNANQEHPDVEFGPTPPDPTPFSDPEALIDLIQRSVAAGTWQNDRVSIAYLNGMLVVTHTRAVHTELRNLLNMLRRAR